MPTGLPQACLGNVRQMPTFARRGSAMRWLLGDGQRRVVLVAAGHHCIWREERVGRGPAIGHCAGRRHRHHDGRGLAQRPRPRTSLMALLFTIGRPYLTVALISVMTAAHYCGLKVFWSVPSVYLSERVKAGEIAMVTAMGSTAAALVPALMGWIKVETGSLSLGLQLTAGLITLAGIVLLAGIPARVLRERAI